MLRVEGLEMLLKLLFGQERNVKRLCVRTDIPGGGISVSYYPQDTIHLRGCESRRLEFGCCLLNGGGESIQFGFVHGDELILLGFEIIEHARINLIEELRVRRVPHQ